MTDFVVVKCPTGTDEVSIGETLFLADDNGLIRIPRRLLHHFAQAGCRQTRDNPSVATVEYRGLVRMQAPASMLRPTIIVADDGTEIEVDERGVAEVWTTEHRRISPGLPDVDDLPLRGRMLNHVGLLHRAGFRPIAETETAEAA